MMKKILCGLIVCSIIKLAAMEKENSVFVGGKVFSHFFGSYPSLGVKTTHSFLLCYGNDVYFSDKNYTAKQIMNDTYKISFTSPTTNIEKAGQKLHAFIKEICPHNEPFELGWKLADEKSKKEGFYTERHYVSYTIGMIYSSEKKNFTEEHFRKLREIVDLLDKKNQKASNSLEELS